jgi:hypothetical protein
MEFEEMFSTPIPAMQGKRSNRQFSQKDSYNHVFLAQGGSCGYPRKFALWLLPALSSPFSLLRLLRFMPIMTAA